MPGHGFEVRAQIGGYLVEQGAVGIVDGSLLFGFEQVCEGRMENRARDGFSGLRTVTRRPVFSSRVRVRF